MTSTRNVALLVLGLVLGALLFTVAPALASNGRTVGTIHGLMEILNGSPNRMGLITSAGASTTNATTAAPFTITRGESIMVQCDIAAFCRELLTASTTVSSSYSSADIGRAVQPGVPWYVISGGGAGTTSFACTAAGTFNCVFFELE